MIIFINFIRWKNKTSLNRIYWNCNSKITPRNRRRKWKKYFLNNWTIWPKTTIFLDSRRIEKITIALSPNWTLTPLSSKLIWAATRKFAHCLAIFNGADSSVFTRVVWAWWKFTKSTWNLAYSECNLFLYYNNKVKNNHI